jgi:Mg2+/Co2+ transporter CorC
MSEDRSAPSGSWLRRLVDSLTGEPRDLGQLTEVLEDARERGLIDTDVLAMLEGVLRCRRSRSAT